MSTGQAYPYQISCSALGWTGLLSGEQSVLQYRTGIGAFSISDTGLYMLRYWKEHFIRLTLESTRMSIRVDSATVQGPSIREIRFEVWLAPLLCLCLQGMSYTIFFIACLRRFLRTLCKTPDDTFLLLYIWGLIPKVEGTFNLFNVKSCERVNSDSAHIWNDYETRKWLPWLNKKVRPSSNILMVKNFQICWFVWENIAIFPYPPNAKI